MATILVIEDDDLTRNTMQALLKYEGHEVLLAANGHQGLLVVRDRRPALILSDVRMPGMSGMEFCQELRKDPEVGDTYVILATGHDTPDVRTEGIAAGADDYIGKPVRSDDLNARVRMGLRIRGLQRDAARLRGALDGSEKLRAGMEKTVEKVISLRGHLMTAVGTMLDHARKAEDAARRGDVVTSLASLEAMRAELEGLRGRLVPKA